jgi:chromosome segregation ATPase
MKINVSSIIGSCLLAAACLTPIHASGQSNFASGQSNFWASKLLEKDKEIERLENENKKLNAANEELKTGNKALEKETGKLMDENNNLRIMGYDSRTREINKAQTERTKKNTSHSDDDRDELIVTLMSVNERLESECNKLRMELSRSNGSYVHHGSSSSSSSSSIRDSNFSDLATIAGLTQQIEDRNKTITELMGERAAIQRAIEDLGESFLQNYPSLISLCSQNFLIDHPGLLDYMRIG